MKLNILNQSAKCLKVNTATLTCDNRMPFYEIFENIWVTNAIASIWLQKIYIDVFEYDLFTQLKVFLFPFRTDIAHRQIQYIPMHLPPFWLEHFAL